MAGMLDNQRKKLAKPSYCQFFHLLICFPFLFKYMIAVLDETCLLSSKLQNLILVDCIVEYLEKLRNASNSAVSTKCGLGQSDSASSAVLDQADAWLEATWEPWVL